MLFEVTKDNFDTEVMQSEIPVLLDFWAPWCGFCTQLMPTVEEIAAEHDGKLKVGKVNVDEQPALAAQFGVMSIPVTIVIDGGEMKSKVLGAYGKEEFLQKHNL